MRPIYYVEHAKPHAGRCPAANSAEVTTVHTVDSIANPWYEKHEHANHRIRALAPIVACGLTVVREVCTILLLRADLNAVNMMLKLAPANFQNFKAHPAIHTVYEALRYFNHLLETPRAMSRLHADEVPNLEALFEYAQQERHLMFPEAPEENLKALEDCYQALRIVHDTAYALSQWNPADPRVACKLMRDVRTDTRNTLVRRS